jgi:hypothetical protein
VAQGIGPEFKFQYHIKKTKQNKKNTKQTEIVMEKVLPCQAKLGGSPQDPVHRNAWLGMVGSCLQHKEKTGA